MNLWIRSQDKEKLCKVHDLCVRENQNENNETNYVIQDIYTMGTYTTKERAIEVLDEIQNILKPKYILDSSSIRLDGDSWVENGIIMQKYNANARIEEISIYVYEMPEN